MVWDPKKHLRDPSGKFRKMNLEPGWYEYRAGKEIKKYYINELGQMESGSTILHMSAQGPVWNKAKHYHTMSRIHLLGNEDDEQFAVAASDQTTFGVINHDKKAPDETFSFNRGHEFQPVSERLPEDETSFGGRALQTSNRKDGHVYGIVNAQEAEKVNEYAFNNPDAHVYTADPSEFAEEVVKARHLLQKMGFSESKARKAPVYVYVNKKGKIVIVPAFRVNKQGEVVPRNSPNTHGGSSTVKLTAKDITRMTRAMQQEGLTNVQFTISHGTVDPDNPNIHRNALHFRKEYYENANSGDRQTMWGTIERVNYGTIVDLGDEHRPDPEKLRQQARKLAERSASRYYEPTDTTGAAKLMRRKMNNPYGCNVEDVSMHRKIDAHDPRSFSWNDPDTGLSWDYDGKGNRIGCGDENTFFTQFNRYRAKQGRPPLSSENTSVRKLDSLITDKSGQAHYGAFEMTVTNPENGKRVTRMFDTKGAAIK